MPPHRSLFLVFFPACFYSSLHAFQPVRSFSMIDPLRISCSGVQPKSLKSGSISRRALCASPYKDSSDETESRTPRSINVLLNELGMSFKTRAEESITKSSEATSKSKRIRFAFTSSIYYMLFLLYRAYRGFFVLLPAIFLRVYAKLQTTMGADLSLEDDGVGGPSSRSASWKTKATVSVLATVVTFSYFVGGTARIISKFLGTIGKTSSLPESFGAAATEAVDHENRIRRRILLSEEEGNEGCDSNAKIDGLLP